MMVTLDGYIEGPEHDLSWHHVDAEFNEFAINQLKDESTILYGRRTYQLMESYWPSEDSRRDDPEVAQLMNDIPKVVVSNSLEKVRETKIWKHVRLIHDDVEAQIRSLKKEKGGNILLMASNNLCVSLLEWGLLDEVRLMINPVVIGKGTFLFEGLKNKINFTLITSRKFSSGNMLLTYSPNQ